MLFEYICHNDRLDSGSEIKASILEFLHRPPRSEMAEVGTRRVLKLICHMRSLCLYRAPVSLEALIHQ